jgi:hypothetical protein
MKMLKAAVAAAVGGTLALAGPADAAQTKRVVVDRGVDQYEFAIDCADFGPFGFENIVTGQQRVQVTEVLAADGTLLRTEIHLTFNETDTNSLTGASLPLKAAVREVLDWEANTRTMTGNVALGTRAGGPYIQEVGRIVMTIDTHEVSFLAGPHDAFFAGGIDPRVCGALAEA